MACAHRPQSPFDNSMTGEHTKAQNVLLLLTWEHTMKKCVLQFKNISFKQRQRSKTSKVHCTIGMGKHTAWPVCTLLHLWCDMVTLLHATNIWKWQLKTFCQTTMFDNTPCSRHDCNPLDMIALGASWTVVVHLDSERDDHALKTWMQIQKKKRMKHLVMLQQH